MKRGKFFVSLLFCIIIFFFEVGSAYAQTDIVINEFSSETTDDWVEVYNAGLSPIDLSSYRLRDSTESNNKDLNGTIEPGQVVVFDFVNYLNKDGDVVKLFTVSGETETLVDSIPFGDQGGVCTPSSLGSVGRYPDANQTIERFSLHTQGNSNNSATLDPCPIPTSVPTNSPTPSTSPTTVPNSTSTPTPRLSLTPTKTPTPIRTPSPSENEGGLTQGDSTLGVLGFRNELQEKIESTGEGQTKKSFPTVAAVFVGLGILLVVFSGFIFFKGKKKLYNGMVDEKNT